MTERISQRRIRAWAIVVLALVAISVWGASAAGRADAQPDVTARAAQPPVATTPIMPTAMAHAAQEVLSEASAGTWRPAPNISWQWQLSGLPVDQSVDAAVYDIDLFDTDADVVAALHARGRKVICYMSAGSWEDWRPDADQFPESVKGSELEGWSDEKWLDIRNLAVLQPIIEARMDLCKARGFDGVEPDNVDGYTNDSGFPLTYQDQITYNTFLANAAHARGLSVGLKNDLDQVVDLEPAFDWALNEQCFEYDECEALLPFVDAGKAVFQVEYNLDPGSFCPQARAMHFTSMYKRLELDAYRKPCDE